MSEERFDLYQVSEVSIANTNVSIVPNVEDESKVPSSDIIKLRKGFCGIIVCQMKNAK
jgi:hypothetical protein